MDVYGSCGDHTGCRFWDSGACNKEGELVSCCRRCVCGGVLGREDTAQGVSGRKHLGENKQHCTWELFCVMTLDFVNIQA